MDDKEVKKKPGGDININNINSADNGDSLVNQHLREELRRSRRGVFGRFKGMLFGTRPALSRMEEELVQSPSRTALRNFFENKLSVAGGVVFLFIVLMCIILPFFFPLNIHFSDVTQQNVAPGNFYLKFPKALQGNAIAVSEGATFGAAVDKVGKVYVWGKLSGSTAPEKLYKIPEGVKFKDVACGLDHVVALGEDGKIYTWGNDRLGLKNTPKVTRGNEIVQIAAGENISVALDDKGKLYVWGSENIIKIRPALVDGLGKIVKFDLTAETAVAVTDKGNAVVLSRDDLQYSHIPPEIQGHVVDMAASKQSAAAVLDDGRIVAWGSATNNQLDVPAKYQGHAVSITAGRYHFSVVLDDGSLGAWGMTEFGQDNAPRVATNKGVRAVYADAGQLNTVALLSDGTVVGWGLKGYLLGADQNGRDVFRRLLTGGRVTLTIGAISVIIAGIIGIIIGGISGYYGGRVDMILMRFAEVVSAIPFMPLAIILCAIIGNRISENLRIVMIMFILGLLSWPSLARLTRAQMLAERENEFVTAAKAMGVHEMGIIFRHILPNVIAVVLVALTIDLATCMLIESSLSFLGFGVQEPNATWGNMLYSCVDSIVMRRYWWRWIFPAISLGLATISLNAVGDGLRDAIDPKSNDR